MKKELIVNIISALLIVLFVYTAMSKFIEFEKFRIELGKSPLLTTFSVWVAWIIPVSEILVSFLLAATRFRLLGLYASFTLMVMFTGYIITILNFSDYIPCSCGGVIQNMSWNEHLVFNAAFCLLALIGIIVQSGVTIRDEKTLLKYT